MCVCIYGYQGGERGDLEGFLEGGNDCSVVISLFLFSFLINFRRFSFPRVKKFVCLEFYYLWLRSVDCDYYRRASSTTNLIFVFTFFYFSLLLEWRRGWKIVWFFWEAEYRIFESLPHSIKNTSALLSFSPRRSKLNFNLDPPNPT